MNWILFWQIAGPIIGLLTLSVTLWLYFWPRREKTKFLIVKPSYTANEGDKVLRVFWSCELQRSGVEEARYVSKICLKPDVKIYRELQKYFSLPECGVITIDKRLKLLRGDIVSSGHGPEAAYPEYEAFKETNDTEKWKIARQLASELSQKAFEVGLVWEDGGKTKWKKIKQGDSGWVRL